MLIIRPLLTGTLYIPFPTIFTPSSPLFTSANDSAGPVPAYVYHIHHPATNTSLLWDLGLRADLTSASPPAVVEAFPVFKPHLTHDSVTGLKQYGIDPAEISDIILSHMHWDHTGDISLFPQATVHAGAGTKAALAPGYPADKDSTYDDAVFTSPRYREVKFGSGPAIGPWAKSSVHDWFGDGSLLMIDAPGHVTGHMIALAKVSGGGGGDGKSKANRWVLLGGDSCHHATHLWTWDSDEMSYGMHLEPEDSKENLRKISTWIGQVEGGGGVVKRGLAHTDWWEEWGAM